LLRNQDLCASTKVFIASNFVGDRHLCYLLPKKNQLICVELEHPETNISDITLGNITVLLAKDAAYLPVIINYTIYKQTFNMNLIDYTVLLVNQYNI
jgi:hypothetical protein